MEVSVQDMRQGVLLGLQPVEGDNGRLGQGKVSRTTVSDSPAGPAGSTGAEMTSEPTQSEV